VKLFVANLHFDKADETALRDLFEPYGPVVRVCLVRDRETDRSRGFAFVTFNERQGGLRACEALNNTQFFGRTLYVHEAEER
jgi:RNA recognition motif-containing protein